MNKITKFALSAALVVSVVSCEKSSDDDNASGYFSVAKGKKVYFAEGNLQYQASTNTWRFAEHQYDIVGKDNENISSTYDGWIDLFGFGTSGWNSGAVAYQPYSTSANSADYCMHHLTDDYANADWGVYNTISNSNQKNGWRTLTSNEWVYLIYIRSNCDNLYSKGKVNGIYGLILLPDDWQLPNGVAFVSRSLDWDTNSYSAEEWRNLETKGAIFLPSPGVVLEEYKNEKAEDGDYWSSSLFSLFKSTELVSAKAYILYGYKKIEDFEICCQELNTRCAVRLVRDLK
ncbi:MAG: hypothetical protein IKZ99_10040 [Salinivirgaceae bacterium]|nr:hypothetical protein [Salinivirgaceae bacterium]